MLVNGNYYSYNPNKQYELGYKLRAAVEEYKEDTLRGLNATCDEVKARRIADFKAAHKPVDGTPEEMRAFLEKLSHYIASLERIADRERTESLINFGGGIADDDESETTPPIIQMYQKMIMVE